MDRRHSAWPVIVVTLTLSINLCSLYFNIFDKEGLRGADLYILKWVYVTLKRSVNLEFSSHVILILPIQLLQLTVAYSYMNEQCELREVREVFTGGAHTSAPKMDEVVCAYNLFWRKGTKQIL
jgi:hypothetical protein